MSGQYPLCITLWQDRAEKQYTLFQPRARLKEPHAHAIRSHSSLLDPRQHERALTTSSLTTTMTHGPGAENDLFSAQSFEDLAECVVV